MALALAKGPGKEGLHRRVSGGWAAAEASPI